MSNESQHVTRYALLSTLNQIAKVLSVHDSNKQAEEAMFARCQQDADESNKTRVELFDAGEACSKESKWSDFQHSYTVQPFEQEAR